MGNFRSKPAERTPSPVDSENLTAEQIGDNELFIGVSISWTRYSIVILDERWRGNVEKIKVAPVHKFNIRQKKDGMDPEVKWRNIVLAVLGNLHRLLSGRYKERKIKKMVICHDYDVILQRLLTHFEPLIGSPRFQGRFNTEVYHCRVYEMYYDLIYDYKKNPNDRMKCYNKDHAKMNAPHSLRVNGILYWDTAIWFMHATHPANLNKEARMRTHETDDIMNRHDFCGDKGSAHWVGRKITDRVCWNDYTHWTETPIDDIPLFWEMPDFFGNSMVEMFNFLREGDFAHRELAQFATYLARKQWKLNPLVKREVTELDQFLDEARGNFGPWGLSYVRDEKDNLVVQQFREAAKIILNNYLYRCLTNDTQKAAIVILGEIGKVIDKLLTEIPPLDIDSEASIKLYTIDLPLTDAARAAALLASYGWEYNEPLVPMALVLRHKFHWHK